MCHQQKAAFFVPSQRTNARFCPPLSIGADVDSDIEAALGQARVSSEYERDAEFYRKRNEAYYNSLHKTDHEEVVVVEFSGSDKAHHQHHHPAASSGVEAKGHHQDNPRWVTDSINTSLKASQNSFDFVEKTTFKMLTGKPLLAVAIFAVAGILAAYLSGFFFLEGYIENWNPAENDMIPYWDDAEIHTIERALPPPPEA